MLIRRLVFALASQSTQLTITLEKIPHLMKNSLYFNLQLLFKYPGQQVLSLLFLWHAHPLYFYVPNLFLHPIECGISSSFFNFFFSLSYSLCFLTLRLYNTLMFALSLSGKSSYDFTPFCAVCPLYISSSTSTCVFSCPYSKYLSFTSCGRALYTACKLCPLC